MIEDYFNMPIEQRLSLLVLVNLTISSVLFFFQKRQTIVCLGYDKCLEVLLNYGLNPNISDQTNTTPLHVAYVVDNVLSFGLSIR